MFLDLFPPLCPKLMFVFVSEMDFLQATYGQVLLFLLDFCFFMFSFSFQDLFLNPTCHSMSFDWRIETINIQCSCQKVCSYSGHFVSFFRV
jgi:hypothetical protein